jgi:hypothetical protein
MAEFNCVGIDGLMLSMQEIMDLPDDVILKMLQAEGDVVAEAQRRQIDKLDLVDTGQMRDSIAVDKKLRSAGRYTGQTIRYIEVYPQGDRKNADGSVKESTRKFKKRRRGETESTRPVTNAEVAFIHEFGAPGRNIKPTMWMRTANEAAADEAVAAAMEVYDDYLKKQNL